MKNQPFYVAFQKATKKEQHPAVGAVKIVAIIFAMMFVAGLIVPM